MSVTPLRREGRRGGPSVGRWADGGAEVRFALRSGRSRLFHLEQRYPCRVLFPVAPDAAPPEAVIANVSGGIVGGDRLRLKLGANRAASVAITTQAAEKVYRSSGTTSEMEITIDVARDACLEWMPQETILFDGARFRRRTDVRLAPASRLITGELTVFGRRARGEGFDNGFLQDSWRIHRNGKLIWADSLHLAAGLTPALQGAYAFGDSAALGLLLCHGTDPSLILKSAREHMGETAGSGVTRLGDLVIARFMDTNAARLRNRYMQLWKVIRRDVAGYDGLLPRVWSI